MAKLTAWVVTLIGLLLVINQILPTLIDAKTSSWLIALAVLVVGIGKLIRNYSYKKK